MDEPSEGLKHLARSLMPDPPGTHEKRKLYEQVGRAIVHLSDIDDLLALAFSILSTSVDIKVTADLYYGQNSLDKKLKLVNHMILHWNKPIEMKVWGRILSKINTHRGVRNLIAHQGLSVTSSSDSPNVDVSLRPPWLKTSSRGKNLGMSEIKKTADALEKIQEELWDFVKKLDRPA
jgi:hypothetical protein